MIKVGHRGACGYEPENTLKSFQKAMALKVDMVELDARQCASGEVVVIHDETVDRTTNGSGDVSAFTLEALQKFDAGQGQSIPTLKEVIDEVKPPIQINIELKGDHIAQAVSDVLHIYLDSLTRSPADFLVSSFNHQELRRFKSFMPDIRIGALFDQVPEDFCEQAVKMGAYSVKLPFTYLLPQMVEEAHEHGLKIFTFTVNEWADIQKYKALGVDGIFSDYPDRL